MWGLAWRTRTLQTKGGLSQPFSGWSLILSLSHKIDGKSETIPFKYVLNSESQAVDKYKIRWFSQAADKYEYKFKSKFKYKYQFD